LRRLLATRLAVITASLVVALCAAPGAQAAPGDLVPLADPFGCINTGGTNGCTLATGFLAPVSVAASPDGKNVYVVAQGSESVVFFNRDPATGALTQPSDPDGCISEDGSGPCRDG
jgi:hypothetical protein